MTLRNQLLSVISVLFLAVLAAILVVSVSGTRQYLEQQLASHAQDAATAMSVTLGQSLGRGDLVLAEAQVVSVFDRGYFKSIDVLGPNRSPLVHRVLPEKIEGVPNWFVARFPIETPAGEAFVGSGWRQLGKVLVVSQPTFAYQHLWQTSVQLLAWLFAICVGALALVLAVLHFILKPLRAIEKTAIDVQAKRFEQITQRPQAPELARVVTAMNQMSRRVGEMLDAETAKSQALHKQAYEDDMTGLVNRRGFELRLTELLQGDYQFALGAVVALEVDDMRLLNRVHGFAAGEHILRTVAETARSVFAEVPVVILARSNEFSFSFVVADVTHPQVAELAAELRRRIMEQLGDQAPTEMVAINIGAAYFRQQDKRSDVFARADLAVESARQSDRNGFVVLPDHPDEHSSLGSHGWRTLIQTALVENRWRLLRQPVLSLNVPSTVLQGECMARLVDAQGALVPASNFMPMASRHRLMPEIDRAMVTLALDYLKGNQQTQEVVAINLSPQSMVDGDFMDWFVGRLNALEEGGRRLAIEVSEFGALRNVAATMRVRDLVRSHGGKFGIDHFGLDPKALNLLRELLPDYVKLTGSLMEEIEAVESASEMLQSFVKLAHSLDVLVIAQQVERAEQLAVLARAEVDAGQGYYFGAPQ
jgi:diguanylate cyclase (GGDEF)-like protein